jgi:L-amino acid N-acyltransferase YncA
MGGQMTVTVRDAVGDDAESIVRILNPIIETGSYTVFDRPFTVDEERHYIGTLPPRAIFHVAISTADDLVVGFQSLEPFATYTRAFDHVGVLGTYVSMAWHRQGVARTLFGATFAAARRNGYEKLFTYIRSDNLVALAVYRSQGFHEVGTAHRHAKLQGRYVDEVIVEKQL